MKISTSLLILGAPFTKGNLLHSNIAPSTYVSGWEEGELRHIVGMDGTEFTHDVFEKNGTVTSSKIEAKDPSVAAKLLFIGNSYGRVRVFYNDGENVLRVKTFTPEEIDEDGVVVGGIGPLVNDVGFFYTTFDDRAMYVAAYLGDLPMFQGKRIVAITGWCSTGEVEYGCEPGMFASGHEPAVLPKVYGAVKERYNTAKMRNGAGITEDCTFANKCSGVVTRHHFHTEDGDIHTYQGGYLGSIGTQMLRPHDASFGDEFLCGELTVEGRFHEDCSDPITTSHYVYRLVSESSSLSEITALSVDGCGIKIVVDGTGISLNDSDPEEFSAGPYRNIQIVRDASVLTVLFGLETTEVAYSELVEVHDGDCQFEVTLPGGFSPFVADVYGRIETIKETTEEEHKSTAEPPNQTATAEIPSKTRTELPNTKPRQCRPKSLRRV